MFENALKISIISIFPDYFSPLEISLLGSAVKKGLIEINTINPRQFANPPHYNVDDTPYGGGAGMVLRADILKSAIEFAINSSQNSELSKTQIIFTSPAGFKFNQRFARRLSEAQNNAELNHIIIICGRFEGYDQRIVEHYSNILGDNNVHEISIGDYVLFGGEVAALVMIEAICRLIPGVVGNPQSLEEESHEPNSDNSKTLEAPSYTRPQIFEGIEVPAILLSGNHGAVDDWRKEQSLIRTANVKDKEARNV